MRIELSGISIVGDALSARRTQDDVLGSVIGELRFGDFAWPIEVARAALGLSRLLKNWGNASALPPSVDLGDGMDFSLEAGGVRIGDRQRFEQSFALAGEFEMIVVCSRFLACCHDALFAFAPSMLPELEALLRSD